MALPTDPKDRKGIPLVRGLLDYFPAACAAVAELSRVANEQHNPGEEMHWAREKSNDHADCIARHLLDRGKVDTDGQRHSTKIAWRALANLQLELEAEEEQTAEAVRVSQLVQCDCSACNPHRTGGGGGFSGDRSSGGAGSALPIYNSAAGVKKDKFICYDCGDPFVTPAGLAAHMMRCVYRARPNDR